MKMRTCPNRSDFPLQSRPGKVLLCVFMDSDTGVVSPHGRGEREKVNTKHI